MAPKYLFFLMMMGVGMNVSSQEAASHLCREPSFPPIPPNGVPLAQIFDSKVTDKKVYLQQQNKVFYIWGAQSPQQPEGVIASKYFPSMRNPDKSLTIDWYKENHPDWVMYQEDKVTPAYGFIYSYGGLTPLDISNPDVREFYLNTFIMPAIKQGYKMVAMDNVELGNWPKSVGHYWRGKWVQLYTGKKDDSIFHRNIISWMQFLSDRLHPLGVYVSANIKATTASPNVVMKVVNAVDMWADETGFTHTGKNITGQAWQKYFSLLRQITPTKAYVCVNQLNGSVEAAAPSQLEWVIGNFLLARGAQSMLSVVGFENNKAEYQVFGYRDEMNVDIGYPEGEALEDSSGAWIRKFSEGIVIVNPTESPTTLLLPQGRWKTLTGDSAEHQIILQPATAVVLGH